MLNQKNPNCPPVLLPSKKRRSNRTGYKSKSSFKTTSIPLFLWDYYGIPLPQTEFMFHDKRQWRIDFAWYKVNGIMIKVAVEIEGGVWSKGRHIRPKGFIEDMEKYNEIALQEWILLRFTPRKIDFDMIRNAINLRRFKC